MTCLSLDDKSVYTTSDTFFGDVPKEERIT